MLTVVQPIQKGCTTRTTVLGWGCTPGHQQTERTWSKGFHLLNHSSPGQNGCVSTGQGLGSFLRGQRRSRAVLSAFLSKARHRSVKGLGWYEHVQPEHPACFVGLQWICRGCAYKDFVNLSCFQSFTVKELCKWPQFLLGMLASPEGYQDVFILHAPYPHFLTPQCPQVGKNFQKGPRSWSYCVAQPVLPFQKISDGHVSS